MDKVDIYGPIIGVLVVLAAVLGMAYLIEISKVFIYLQRLIYLIIE